MCIGIGRHTRPRLTREETTRPESPMDQPEVCFSLGMGVDSVALALLWIHDPATRPCPLDRILFVSAMTGDEWPITGTMMTDHVLPVFREHHIRYAQIARAGMRDADGIAVLDDSREPCRMYLRGPVALSQEMVLAGTVPQVGGQRKCSLKWKGWPADQFLAREITGSYVQVMGYEAGERRRARQDPDRPPRSRPAPAGPAAHAPGATRVRALEAVRGAAGLPRPRPGTAAASHDRLRQPRRDDRRAPRRGHRHHHGTLRARRHRARVADAPRPRLAGRRLAPGRGPGRPVRQDRPRARRR